MTWRNKYSGGLEKWKIFLAGNWVDKPKKLEVKNPFDNSVIDTVPKADAADLEKALMLSRSAAPK